MPPAAPASPPKPSSTTPTVARAVATIQVAVGTRRVSAHSSSPARIGAEPSATTVPTATPLRSVPRKKSGWYTARQTPVSTMSDSGRMPQHAAADAAIRAGARAWRRGEEERDDREARCRR